MYNIIKHMYEETNASVKHQGILSDIFECCIRVRQGESISPFLFNLFLNDLDEALSVGQFQGINIGDINLKTLIYADDLTLLIETRKDLQVGLDILYDYCNRCKLTINTEKNIYNYFQERRKCNTKWPSFFRWQKINKNPIWALRWAVEVNSPKCSQI